MAEEVHQSSVKLRARITPARRFISTGFYPAMLPLV